MHTLNTGRSRRPEISLIGCHSINIVSWTTMITAYAQDGHMQLAELLFERAPHRNAFTWSSMVTGYARRGETSESRRYFESSPVKNLVLWNAMLAAYAHNGHLEEARVLFDKMSERDEISWTLLMQAYAREGYIEEAARMFEGMPKKDVVAWTTMLQVYAQNGYHQEAKMIFDNIPRKDVVSWTYMIQVCGRNGRLQMARSIFNTLPVQNVVSWNEMLQVYAQNGYHVYDLFQQMNLGGYEPDSVTFMIILGMLSHSGCLRMSKQFFMSMCLDYELTPTIEHYRCMIDTFTRSGHLEDAGNLVESMPYKGDSFAWVTLLGACNVNGGRVSVSEVLTAEDKLDSGPYVALANSTHAHSVLNTHKVIC